MIITKSGHAFVTTPVLGPPHSHPKLVAERVRHLLLSPQHPGPFNPQGQTVYLAAVEAEALARLRVLAGRFDDAVH